MVESLREQAMAALATAMESITSDEGVTGWYTPDKVERTHSTELRALLTESYETIYAFAPGRLLTTEESSEGVEEEFEFNFLLARQHHVSDEPYFAEAPSRWIVQDRLAEDFLTKVWEDVTLDGLTFNVDVSEITYEADETYVEGWAMVAGIGALRIKRTKGRSS